MSLTVQCFWRFRDPVISTPIAVIKSMNCCLLRCQVLTFLDAPIQEWHGLYRTHTVTELSDSSLGGHLYLDALGDLVELCTDIGTDEPLRQVVEKLEEKASGPDCGKAYTCFFSSSRFDCPPRHSSYSSFKLQASSFKLQASRSVLPPSSAQFGTHHPT